MELEDECPGSPQFDRLSMKSDSPSETSSASEDKTRLVVTSLLAAAHSSDDAVG